MIKKTKNLKNPKIQKQKTLKNKNTKTLYELLIIHGRTNNSRIKKFFQIYKRAYSVFKNRLSQKVDIKLNLKVFKKINKLLFR
ncbi:hypothetical protein AGMMS49960_21890 [Betaproteobacteria bacterium]|nr:hypothetical protein AGMMS49960_21890 [Betaproteobacteria bacterium]